MSAITENKEKIETWLNDDGWKWFKESLSDSVGTKYTITSTNDRKFQLNLDNKIEKIIISYRYTISPELKNLGESQVLDFSYELGINLMPIDIYLKYDPETQTFELKNFIFWDECIKNNLLQSMYKMDQIIDLLKIKDKQFVNHRPTN